MHNTEIQKSKIFMREIYQKFRYISEEPKKFNNLGGNIMKRFISVLLAILMTAVMTLTTSAALPGGGTTVQPMWEYMDAMTVDLGFSGTNGTAVGTVSRIFSVTTRLEGTLTVYEVVDGEWIYVDSTSGSSTRSLALDLEFTGNSGSEYIAVFEVTAYSGTLSESDSATHTATCP